MFSRDTKRLLQNVIRHTNAHNRVVEEAEMWQQHGRLKELGGLDPAHPSYFHDDRFGDDKDVRPSRDNNSWHVPFSREGYGRHARMDDEKQAPSNASGAKRSTYWMRQLQKLEAAHPDRWDHSGYKELYPDYFDSDRSRSSSSESTRRKPTKKKKRKDDKHKKKKKKKKKVQADKSKHKHKRKKRREQSSSESDSSDSEPVRKSRSKKKLGNREQLSSHFDSSDSEQESSHSQSNNKTCRKSSHNRRNFSSHSSAEKHSVRKKHKHTKKQKRRRKAEQDSGSDSGSSSSSSSEEERKRKKQKKKHRHKHTRRDSDSSSNTSPIDDRDSDSMKRKRKHDEKLNSTEKVVVDSRGSREGGRDHGTNGVSVEKRRSSSSHSEEESEVPRKKRRF